jgi:uncharacterized protein (DUF302 family)
MKCSAQPRSRLTSGLLLVTLLVCAACENPNNGAQSPEAAHSFDYRDNLYIRKTNKSFEDVEWELEFAITERNFRITGKNTIGAGLRNRGYPDYPDVTIIHFCSLERAREVLDMDIGFTAVMPCRIAIYQEGDQVTIAAIMLPETHEKPGVVAFAREFNALQREIVDFVMEENR